MFDTLVRGGTAVTPEGPIRADIAIADGVIGAVGLDPGPARAEIVADGLVVLPAVIDIHVHFNEPGRTTWEGAATGSRALAAGGGTVFFDMPLNSTPCTVTPHDVALKRHALESSSITDFALWGGLVPGSVEAMAGMAEAGVIGFKAFMCDSGLPEFPRSDDMTLLRGLREAARLDVPVAVHAESAELVSGLGMRAEGRCVSDFLRSRPVLAEIEAIQRALLFAGEAGARLHLVHVSSGRGVALAAEARADGVDVSIETCPHYLYFTEDDLDRLGAIAKCAPPLRTGDEQQRLWTELARGTVDIVASDHSPAEPRLKDGDFWSAWGGVAGVQSTLAVLLDRGHHDRGLPLARIASMTSAEPARRFRIEGKGSVAEGLDADLVLVDPGDTWTLAPEDLHQRHRLTPYLGRSFRGRVRRTIRRGETIFAEGRITATTRGRFLRPMRAGG
jgi:allantoinase